MLSKPDILDGEAEGGGAIFLDGTISKIFENEIF